MAVRAPIGGTEPNHNGNGHRSSPLESGASQQLLRQLWQYQPYLKRLCESIVGDAATADDVVQDTFERALVHLPRLDTDSSLFPWLATVARRRSLNELRRRQYATPVEVVPEKPLHPLHAVDDTADRASTNAALERLGQALDLLTARERELLFRQVDGGPSLAELAAYECSSRDSIKSVLKRARRKLREATYGAAVWLLAPIGLLAARLRNRVALSGARLQQLGYVPSVERVGEMATAAAVVMAISVAGSTPAVDQAPQAERERRGATTTTVLDGARLAGLPIAGIGGGRPLISSLLEGTLLGGDGADSKGGSSLGSPNPSGGTGAANGDTTSDSDSGDAQEPGSDTTPPLEYGDTPPGSTPSTTEPPRPRSDPDPENPLNEADPMQPEDAYIQEFAAVPTASGSGELFALGKTAGHCEKACTVLFHSPDGGATWERRSANGLDAVQLMPAPGYPRDPRIYARGPDGLQVSLDGGRTFAPVENAPYSGPAAMSPGFSEGDQRILIGAAPIWVYDAASDAARPFAVGTPVASPVSHLAFVPGDVFGQTVFVGTKVIVDGRARPAVLRCDGDECGEPVEVPVLGPPEVFVAVDGTVLAWAGSVLLRSTDGGSSFARLELPVRGAIRHVTNGSDGTLYVAIADMTGDSPAGALLASSNGGSSWRPLGSGTVLERGVATVTALPGGRLLAAPSFGAGSGVHCSRDRGATWNSRC